MLEAQGCLRFVTGDTPYPLSAGLDQQQQAAWIVPCAGHTCAVADPAHREYNDQGVGSRSRPPRVVPGPATHQLAVGSGAGCPKIFICKMGVVMVPTSGLLEGLCALTRIKWLTAVLGTE